MNQPPAGYPDFLPWPPRTGNGIWPSREFLVWAQICQRGWRKLTQEDCNEVWRQMSSESRHEIQNLIRQRSISLGKKIFRDEMIQEMIDAFMHDNDQK